MNTARIAVFPGSFDPVTLGHENIVRRALPLFDKIVIAIGRNAEKSGMFPVEVRKIFLDDLFKDEKRVETAIYDTLTIDFCRSINARFILRGLRSGNDFEYERLIGLSNQKIAPEIESVFLMADNRYDFTSSTVARDLLRYGKPLDGFVPEPVCGMIRTYLAQKP